MNPRFARARPDMTVDEAISYLRPQTRQRIESVYYAYVLDADQKLLGVVSFRQLFGEAGNARIRDIMVTQVLTIPENMDQETVSQIEVLTVNHSVRASLPNPGLSKRTSRFPFAIRLAKPDTTNDIASVVISALMRNLAMTTPLMKPTKAPQAIAASSPSRIEPV